jgi:DNA uptake protein ComE-like DNA-binding protein
MIEVSGKWEKKGAVLLDDKKIPNPLGADLAVGLTLPDVVLSSAKRDELESIDGVGPVLADRIMKLRRKLGGSFHVYDDLAKAEGIGDATVIMLRNDKRVKLY